MIDFSFRPDLIYFSRFRLTDWTPLPRESVVNGGQPRVAFLLASSRAPSVLIGDSDFARQHIFWKERFRVGPPGFAGWCGPRAVETAAPGAARASHAVDSTRGTARNEKWPGATPVPGPLMHQLLQACHCASGSSRFQAQ